MTWQSSLTALSARLDPRAAEALARLDGPGRQLLAARSYLRGSYSLADRWSWSQEQIAAYQGSLAQQQLDAQIDLVRKSFEANNPGYTLFVNPQVRSLDTQIERWNTNASVAQAAEQLLADAIVFIAAVPAPVAGEDAPADPERLEQFLISYSPLPTPTIAAPGLSPHGQMRAVDFQVLEGDRPVAGPDTATIESEWLEAGWRDKLLAAVIDSAAAFAGPLEIPDEPWHYNYLGVLDSSGETIVESTVPATTSGCERSSNPALSSSAPLTQC